MIVDNVTIHNNVYPYPEPAAILLAQLPGSIKPTVTNKPGPIYLKKFIVSFVDDLKNCIIHEMFLSFYFYSS